MIKPLNDRIVVRRNEAESVTDGGIHLPDVAKERPKQGTVVAVGPGKLLPDSGKRLALCVKEGDKVLFPVYAGNEVEIDGEKLLIMSEMDILGTLS